MYHFGLRKNQIVRFYIVPSTIKSSPYPVHRDSRAHFLTGLGPKTTIRSPAHPHYFFSYLPFLQIPNSLDLRFHFHSGPVKAARGTRIRLDIFLVFLSPIPDPDEYGPGPAKPLAHPLHPLDRKLLSPLFRRLIFFVYLFCSPFFFYIYFYLLFSRWKRRKPDGAVVSGGRREWMDRGCCAGLFVCARAVEHR